MEKIDLLNTRKTKLYAESTELRKKLSEIIDDSSFVELNAYAFGKNEFYGEGTETLGVLTGYATIDDYPVYIVAQNSKVCNGGLSKANCDKIVSCLEKALGTRTPVLYLLDSQGVQVGEGVAVLEGIASILKLSNQLKDCVPQFAVAIGDVLGSTSLLCANADYTYVLDNSCIAYASPAVISASNKNNTPKDVIGGSKSSNGVKSFVVKSLNEVKESVIKVLNILPEISGILVDTDDDLNRSSLILNSKKDAKLIIDAVFDKDNFVELYKGYSDDVIVGIGRVGGISTGAIVFDGGEEGVELNLSNVLKIQNFASYVIDNNLPLLTFVNTKGIKTDLETSSTPVMCELMNTLYNLSNTARVSVVYGKAIGLGYTAFASKEFGNVYTYAFSDAKISLFDGEVGTAIEFGTFEKEKLQELKEKYAEMQDVFNSAKLGCVDNIIEPQFVRQYVISALQTIVR